MQLKQLILSLKNLAVVVLIALTAVPRVFAIMAGDENALPADSPANRPDPLDVTSSFNAIGSQAGAPMAPPKTLVVKA